MPMLLVILRGGLGGVRCFNQLGAFDWFALSNVIVLNLPAKQRYLPEPAMLLMDLRARTFSFSVKLSFEQAISEASSQATALCKLALPQLNRCCRERLGCRSSSGSGFWAVGDTSWYPLLQVPTFSGVFCLKTWFFKVNTIFFWQRVNMIP